MERKTVSRGQGTLIVRGSTRKHELTAKSGAIRKHEGALKSGSTLNKHANTTIGTLRSIYGKEFAKGFDSHEKLATVIKKVSKARTSGYYAEPSEGSAKKKSATTRKVSTASVEALANATVVLGPALKRLADR